ncbi:MAG: orotidine-5'-phosphate decarboxylase [Nannocystaceae bacterium]
MDLQAARERLIVALDVPDLERALSAAASLEGHVGMLKIGLELFVAEGPNVVREIRARYPSLGIFLDLKLHDIPNTMAGAIRSARASGANLITVHAGSGVDHLKACVEAAEGELGVLAVTVLTSQDANACREAGHSRSTEELVAMRAICAREAGCTGVVSSAHEVSKVASVAPGLMLITPGIRPAGSAVGDQKRVMTPADAIAAGSTHLVIGRPIMQADNRAEAADAIVREIAEASRG